MRFARPPARRRGEAVVPMINVVFLLLIFFMMSATIAPAPPFDLALPRAEGAGEAPADRALYLAADGALSYAGAEGAAAWEALAAQPPDAPLVVRADAALPAPQLAALLTRLAGAGIPEVSLTVRRP